MIRLLYVTGFFFFCFAGCESQLDVEKNPVVDEKDEKTKPSSAVDKITLRLNMKKGDTRNFVQNVNVVKNVNFDQTLNSVQNLSMALKITVDDVDKHGLHTMTFQYKRFKYRTKIWTQKIDYDSDKDKDNLDPLVQDYPEHVGKSFTAKITPQGHLEELAGLKLCDMAGGKIGRWFAKLPTMPVGIGDSWRAEIKTPGDSSLKVKVKYTLTDRKSGEATLKLDGTITDPEIKIATMTGTLRIDEKTGWTNSGEQTTTWSPSPNVDMIIKTTFGDIEIE